MDDARRGEGKTSQRRGRRRADQSLINEVDLTFDFSSSSTVTPIESYYPTFDFGESSSVPHDDSQYQTVGFVTPPIETLCFAQFNGSQSQMPCNFEGAAQIDTLEFRKHNSPVARRLNFAADQESEINEE
ncbi:hypothetical protein HAX54_049339 [Datura stramonium]|uniref:Uncharacterized protein n=1 Tax=Datura stramonium TaxID=4076 RepID=A0ABS8SWE8_DATST|nr:hypothetical protein [Datura stramonium]